MRLRLLLIVAALFVAPMAFAGTYSLNDWCFYVNSLDINHSCNQSGADNFVPPVSPGTFDFSHLTDQNALGSVTITLPPGNYNVFAFYDYDVQGGSPSALNEFASVVGSAAIGQVYSVDAQGDPSSGGAVTATTPGFLHDQFVHAGDLVGGAPIGLDNTNHLPSCATAPCEDVSVSLGYTNVTVAPGVTTTITFDVGSTAPTSGSFIQQTDSTSGNSVFFSSTLTSTPEPGTVVLMSAGLGMLLMGLRRRRA
jgi:hypothetical protein